MSYWRNILLFLHLRLKVWRFDPFPFLLVKIWDNFRENIETAKELTWTHCAMPCQPYSKVYVLTKFLTKLRSNVSYSDKKNGLRAWISQELLQIRSSLEGFVFRFFLSICLFLFSFKAELLQLKLTQIICLMNFIDKKVGNRKN